MFRLNRTTPGTDRSSGPIVAVDYYATPCTSAQLRIDAATGAPALSAVYAGARNQPNAIYVGAGAPLTFSARTMHLRGRVHDVAGMRHDGEIVVEHAATANSNTRLFSCFPVVRREALPAEAREDPVARLLRAADPSAAREDDVPPEVCLNDCLPPDPRLIVYESRDCRGMPCRVLVFLDEILTGADISGFSASVGDLFDAVPRGAPEVAMARRASGESSGELRAEAANEGVEGFEIGSDGILKSTGTADDIFTCEYLPVDTDTVQVFQIPIDTNMVSSTANQEMTSMALYFVLSIVFAGMVFFAAPVMYGSSLTAYFKTPLPSALASLNGLFMTSGLTWADVIIVGVLTVLAVGLTSAGISSGKNPLKIAGLVIMVVLVVGISGVHISGKMGWREAALEEDALNFSANP